MKRRVSHTSTHNPHKAGLSFRLLQTFHHQPLISSGQSNGSQPVGQTQTPDGRGRRQVLLSVELLFINQAAPASQLIKRAATSAHVVRIGGLPFGWLAKVYQSLARTKVRLISGSNTLAQINLVGS